MPKPTLTEHRAQIRALLAAMSSAAIYDDGEIDQALRTALAMIPDPITRSVTLTVAANQTTLELADHCPAEAVTEIAAPGNQIITEFRARGTQLILRTAITAAGTATIYYRACPTIGPGDAVDWYNPAYRGPICAYAASLLMLARAAELTETDPAKAAQLIYAAQSLARDATTALGLTQPRYYPRQ